MQPHQQRVVDEKSELDGKLAKLKFFLAGDLFKTVNPDEQKRLTTQAKIMCDYSEILGERIANFPTS